MEYIREKDKKEIKLTKELKEDVAKKIAEEFKTYDDARTEQIDKAKLLIEEIFFRNVAKSETEKSKKWKSKIKTCKIFMYSQILKAFVWKNIYANTNSMFDVAGQTLESDNNSNKQKTMLVNILEGMDYPKTCDKIIDESLIYGELISYCTWRKHSEEIRRPISMMEAIIDPTKLPKIAEAKLKGKNFYVDERVDYDNPYIYAVDPANFVFDSTQYNDWEFCPKILRTWRTPDDIINNQYFEVSDDCKEYIRNITAEGSDISDGAEQESNSLKDRENNGSTVEVLEHWGNLRMKDGTVLHNWYAVVVAGKYLVAFEKNPFIINPFTYGCYVQDPYTKRGISPLYSIYDIALTQEKMLRKTMDLQALAENPPRFCAKGFFGKDPANFEVAPGKVIEYDKTLYGEQPITAMEFNVGVFSDDLEYIDSLMSEVSGVFPNMAGAAEADRTTATEITTKVEGQLTRLKMLLDVINQNLILEDVKKVAKLKSNFTFGEEKLFNPNDNTKEELTITDDVRQGDYKYTYQDRSATSERFNFADMVAQSAQMFLKAGTPIDPQQMFTWYMGEKGIENPERFLVNQNTIDPRVQEVLLQNPQMAQFIEQATQMVNSQGQQQSPQNEGSTVPQVEQIEPQEQEQELPEQLNSLPGRNLLSNG